MKTLKQEYRQFLNENFKGLLLRKPLFYNWDFGLRFDLQIGELNNSTRRVLDEEGNEIIHEGDIYDSDKYFEEVIRRATTLFKSSFEGTDNLCFIFMDYKHKRRKIRCSNFAFRQIKGLKKDEIKYTKEHRLYEPGDKLDISNIALVKCKADRVNFKEILIAIGNTDFGSRKPRLDEKRFFNSKEIYFINLDKKLILHMYDDRGLDIIATDRETLKSIYLQNKNWILDYDRKKIEKLFE